jgi:peptide/nickel transport system substrate-binding protein
VFSAERTFGPNSDIKTRIQPVGTKAVKVDDHTVDFVLPSPNPILHYEWEHLVHHVEEMGGREQHRCGATRLRPVDELRRAQHQRHRPVHHRRASGRREDRVQENPNWWGKVEHNIDEAIFTTIGNDATRVAALLSGDVDWIDPVPLQDVQRINASGVAEVMQGPELRTIFLGFDQMRPELKTPTSRARTRSRTCACARRSIWRSTRTRSRSA